MTLGKLQFVLIDHLGENPLGFVLISGLCGLLAKSVTEGRSERFWTLANVRGMLINSAWSDWVVRPPRSGDMVPIWSTMAALVVIEPIQPEKRVWKLGRASWLEKVPCWSLFATKFSNLVER